jgi:uncharacterized protein (DUF2141 family)
MKPLHFFDFTIKYLIGFILLFLTLAPAISQNKAVLTVKVDSIKTIDGRIYAAVYKNQDDFKNNRAIQREKKVVLKPEVTLSFLLPVNQTYSVALFQDLNNDEKLNTKGSMKIPDEPIGFSNNKPGKFGPPGFNKTSFVLKNDTTLFIHIISSKKEYLQNNH